MTTTQIDLGAVKAKQQATWATGDYAVIGTALQLVGELLCEALDVSAGERVLDVAAGNGNASLAAARRGCEVTALDYVPELLAGTAARAKAEGREVECRQGDAEDLPFAPGSFDVVVSTFGVMFTPDHDRAAAELRRVCRPGGRIGLANWTPEGFVGQMFKIVGRYAPPPSGVPSPMQWGTDPALSRHFAGCASLEVAERDFLFRYRSPQHWVDTFRTFYGPMAKAFGAVDDTTAASLEADLLALADSLNTATDGTMRVPGRYLEVIARMPA